MESPLTCVPAIGPARAKKLAERLGLRCVGDLLTHYPTRYMDFSQPAGCGAAPIGQEVTVVGEVKKVTVKRPRPRMTLIEVAVVDRTGVLVATFFNMAWLQGKIPTGARIALSGKVAFDYGYKRMTNPFFELLDEEGQSGPQIFPVHRVCEGVTTAMMRRYVLAALDLMRGRIPDNLPSDLQKRYRLWTREQALWAIHFPATMEERHQARRRLAYEEIFDLQCELQRQRLAEQAGAPAVAHSAGEEALAAYTAQLPFTLTAEQQAALAEIAADLRAPRCMNRMLLGDVGCGKTVVAGGALALCAKSGCQAAMMAPTEVLARQYGRALGPILEKCGVRWAILTSSTPAVPRREILAELASGALQVVFGTHALIQDDVEFARLTLTVVDEQHRFGVGQREALRAKGPGADLLTMTATPIPRTLALALYGDLETSVIRRRPGHCAGAHTQIISRANRRAGYEAIRQAVASGRQAYIICPLVGIGREERKGDEADSLDAAVAEGRELVDLRAAQQEAEILQREVFPQLRVGLLTGQAKPAEKQQVMDDFSAGKIDVLVATTVVEVGVDVPNATVMMVEDAERFGLAQLHQLRGRIGRGRHAGEFFLVADPAADDKVTCERLEALCRTNDGFELAEIDLALRREGDLLGLRQSGASPLKLVHIINDARMIECAHSDAKEFVCA